MEDWTLLGQVRHSDGSGKKQNVPKHSSISFRLNILYLFKKVGPEYDSSCLPDKFWVLNDKTKTPEIYEATDSSRPHSVVLQFPWQNVNLTLSDSLEKDLWINQLKKASSFDVRARGRLLSSFVYCICQGKFHLFFRTSMARHSQPQEKFIAWTFLVWP